MSMQFIIQLSHMIIAVMINESLYKVPLCHYITYTYIIQLHELPSSSMMVAVPIRGFSITCASSVWMLS